MKKIFENLFKKECSFLKKKFYKVSFCILNTGIEYQAELLDVDPDPDQGL